MRGFWYIIEAVIVSSIVISFLMVVGGKYSGTVQPESLAERGYMILKGLDNRGELRNYTVADDFEGLNSLIPLYNYNHTVQICDYEGDCAGQRSNATSIWTANYIIAGDSVYRPHIIRLYISPL